MLWSNIQSFPSFLLLLIARDLSSLLQLDATLKEMHKTRTEHNRKKMLKIFSRSGIGIVFQSYFSYKL